MEERIFISRLYDLYGKLLTDKQREIFEDYYFDNLTFEEIATNHRVSKNAVSKHIKTVKTLLMNYEEKLRLNEYLKNLKKEFKDEKEILMRISKYDNIIL